MQTIVIVEQHSTQRAQLARWLRDDYLVFMAADGVAGLALVERHEPDLIFLALTLPDLDGAAMVRQLKAQARLRDIPLVALPSPAMPGADVRARAAGCTDAFRAPLEEEHVSAMLTRWLGGG